MQLVFKTSAAVASLAACILSAASFADCSEALNTTTPPDRFSNTSDDGAVVTDAYTQLEWMRCSMGQAWNQETKSCDEDAATPASYTFSEALAMASSVNAGGTGGWRLPNKKELASIVDYSCTEPAVNREIFPATHAVTYWSSTPRVYASNFMAFAIDFTTGAFVDAGLEAQHAVRLVRDAQ